MRWPSMQPTPLRDRFWAKVERRGDAECWAWVGAVDANGYGKIRQGGIVDGGRVLYAHRVSYELAVGPIPKGLTLDHLCRNTACVNPAHLEAVTNWENIRRTNSWTAQRARSTSCVHGHPFTPANTYRYGPDRRWRMCKTCSRGRKHHSRSPVKHR